MFRHFPFLLFGLLFSACSILAPLFPLFGLSLNHPPDVSKAIITSHFAMSTIIF